MKDINPCQLNAAIAAITNHLYCTLSREDFTNLGVALSMLSRSIIQMAALEELLRWEHRDLRAERQLREAKERRRGREQTPPGLRPSHQATEEVHQRKEELADEESLLTLEEEFAAEGELLAEEEILAAESEL